MLTSFYDIARQVHENNYYQYVENNYIGEEIEVNNAYNAPITPIIYGNSYQAPNPTVSNPQPILVSGGSSIITTNNTTQSYWLTLPDGFGAVGDVVDEIYKDKGKVWLKKTFNYDLLDDTKDLQNQEQALIIPPTITDITTTPIGQAYLQLQSFYPYTKIYSNASNEVKPWIDTNIKLMGVVPYNLIKLLTSDKKLFITQDLKTFDLKGE